MVFPSLVNAPNNQGQNDLWADQAFMGIPFNDTFTLEMGKYRSTYGPLPLTNNFFYDDVNLSGARGIVKTGNLVINPFVEWMDEAQNSVNNPVALDATQDNDEIRMGGHLKYTINKDWFVGGMLGYQMDDRNETTPDLWTSMDRITANDGGFGSLYVNGKSGAFGVVAELSVTDGNLNGMNSWLDDSNRLYLPVGDVLDSIGSNDTGFGGYVFPNFTVNKLNIGLNLGFTDGGFQPDRAFGFVMLGGTDNSWISASKIGVTGDWMWAGLVANYSINESLKLTGNLVYADVDPWTSAGDGPSFRGGVNQVAIDSAWELSAVLQYTISKGMDVYLSAGYLDPTRELVNATPLGVDPTDDAAFGALTRFELKF